MMYYQGLQSLEESTDTTSQSEIENVRVALHNVLNDVTMSALALKAFTYTESMIATDNPLDWSETVRAFSFGMIEGNKNGNLAEAGITLVTHDPTDRSAFMSAVWIDPLKEQKEQLVYAAYNDRLPNETFVLTADKKGCESILIQAYDADRVTGIPGEFVYDYEGAPDMVHAFQGLNFTAFADNVSLVNIDPSPEPGVFTESAVNSYWWEPMMWRSSDGFLHAFRSHITVFLPPPPPHRWSRYKAVLVTMGLLYRSFQPPFNEYKLAHPDTILLALHRQSNFFHGSTEGPMIPQYCQEGGSSGEGVLDCAMHLFNASKAIQEGVKYISKHPFDDFRKGTFDGTEYFIRRVDLKYGGTELIWMRPTSSVQGKVEEALRYLIMFVCLVLAFDLVVAVLEVVYVAMPLLRLTTAIDKLGKMNTTEAENSVKKYRDKTVMVKEIRALMDGMMVTVKHLKGFRTFMPDVLFDEEDDEEEKGAYDRSPPGLATNTAAIVFTDICGSTSLWEADHEGMRLMLKEHNTVLRKEMELAHGYEVKTIGDAFMIAFDDINDALQFGFNAQQAIATLKWPDTSESALVLNIRIGVNEGAVSSELNTKMGRFDYHGPTVNRAARLEAACPVGGVALFDCLLQEKKLDLQGVFPTANIKSLGEVTMKGVPEPMRVTAITTKAATFKRSNSASTLSTYRSSAKDVKGPKERFNVHENASIAFMKMDQDQLHVGSATDEVNVGVSRMLSYIERCEGKIISVGLPFLSVGWNVAKPCTAHADRALKFAGVVSNGVTAGMSLCTSKVLYGYTSTGGQRFVATAGKALQVCVKAFTFAQLFNTTVLASEDGDIVRMLLERNACRRVTEGNVGGWAFTIYELCTWRLQESFSTLDHCDDDEPAVPGWEPECVAALNDQNFFSAKKFAHSDPVVEYAVSQAMRVPSSK